MLVSWRLFLALKLMHKEGSLGEEKPLRLLECKSILLGLTTDGDGEPAALTQSSELDD